MDELHAAYIERHRNLTYLESELEKIERDEEDAAAAHAAELDAMRGKLRAEELRRVLYLTLVPIRPRSRGARRFLRTLPAFLSAHTTVSIPDTPRRLSTPLLTPFNSTPTFARTERPSGCCGAKSARTRTCFSGTTSRRAAAGRDRARRRRRGTRERGRRGARRLRRRRRRRAGEARAPPPGEATASAAAPGEEGDRIRGSSGVSWGGGTTAATMIRSTTPRGRPKTAATTAASDGRGTSRT